MNTWPFKILVKYATRGRREKFFGGMDTIYGLAEESEYVFTMITADEDDPEMNTTDVRERIRRYPNTKIIYGESESKIAAINRDLDILPDEMKDWKILVNFSDDQRFVMPKWDTYIRVDFNSVFPDFCGYMSYLDPDTRGALTTTSIIGRAYFDLFNFIYDPQFKSLFCDNLSDDCAKALGKYHFSPLQLIHHYNPSYGYPEFPPDEMYIEQQRIGWSEDQELYYKIKANGIDKYLSNFGCYGG